MLVMHQLGKFHVRSGRLSFHVWLRLFTESIGQGRGDFLQGLMAEIAFGGKIARSTASTTLLGATGSCRICSANSFVSAPGYRLEDYAGFSVARRSAFPARSKRFSTVAQTKG